MERLGVGEVRAILDFLDNVYTLSDLDAFRVRLVSALPKMVRSEITTYWEIDPSAKRTPVCVENPNSQVMDAVLPERLQLFDRHMDDHPPLMHHVRTGDGQPLRISDFCTHRQFRRCGLYNEMFHRLSIEYQVTFFLPGPAGLVVGSSLHRDTRDYSDREVLAVSLIRPHLGQAYLNAVAFTRVQQTLKTLSHAVELADDGVIVLANDGRIDFATASASRMLADYFRDFRSPSARLPCDMEQWIRSQESAHGRIDETHAAHMPFEAECSGKRLTVRLLKSAQRRLLFFEERATTISMAPLRRLNLTPREAEIMACLAAGKTNAAIATTLGTTRRTISKHLEHIYDKLGVKTRAGAVARVLGADR